MLLLVGGTTKYIIALLQLCDLILQRCSHFLTRRRLRSSGTNIRIREVVYDEGGKDLLEAADDVPFNHLRRDICDKRLLGDLKTSGISV